MSFILNNLGSQLSRSRINLDKLLCHEFNKITIIPSRSKFYHNRHRDQKYRKERSWKVWKLDLPDFDKLRQNVDISPEEARAKLKEKGVAPPRQWGEKSLFNSCTMALVDPYVVSTDGKSSSLGKLKVPIKGSTDYIKNRRALSAIRDFEGEDFDLANFAKESVNIYIKAHEALAAKDERAVFDYVTEHCFPLMTAGINHHTINWKYLGEVEPPACVQTRAGDMVSKGNKFGQITVKLHTRQILAIYDRHGRLVHGSPIDVKEVLEYIVFEKYLANEYGLWRIHERIKPEQEKRPLAEQVAKTYVVANSS